MRTRVLFLLLSALIVSRLLVTVSACGGAARAAPVARPTAAHETGSGGQAVQTGGTLNVATEPGTIRDPALASARSDILLNQQVYDWLVEVGDNNQLLPGLATAWDSPDGKVWTFTLRSGVTFSNGQPFTADDVVYTFNRLQDPNVGSPLAADPGQRHRRSRPSTPPTSSSRSKTPTPSSPATSADYHAAILSKIGAGPGQDLGGHGAVHARSRMPPRTGPSSRRTRATG